HALVPSVLLPRSRLLVPAARQPQADRGGRAGRDECLAPRRVGEPRRRSRPRHCRTLNASVGPAPPSDPASAAHRTTTAGQEWLSAVAELSRVQNATQLLCP